MMTKDSVQTKVHCSSYD